MQYQYQSAFADYKPYRDLARGDWKTMNEATGKPRSAHKDTSSSPQQAAPPGATAEPRGHAGHMQHGGRQ